ncbi:hypothetical protein [Chryseobacterium sp. G0201]|uniref:hypothetical protein n=1 Tax=Chryseobacterium sp. G0201 TaxID=2487065 RepID=UPI000F4D5DAF|nr:hypothetical protein [Chryseobacterium sp. G0201]
MKNLLIFFMFPVFLFCNFLQVKDLQGNGCVENEKSLEAKGQIVYLFFKVEKNISGAEKVVLEDKKIMEGRLKSKPSFDRNSAKTGDFIISLNDENGKEIVKQIVENPLNPELERFDGEGISRNKVTLQNAEFSVRYSHSEEIKVVRVVKVTTAGTQLLFTQKL